MGLADAAIATVVMPFLAGAPWYRLRFIQRTVSSFPKRRTTRFVTVFTTASWSRELSKTTREIGAARCSLTFDPQ